MRLEDLAGPVCTVCGAPMADNGRRSLYYCSVRCQQRHWYATGLGADRAASRKGLTCPECGTAFDAGTLSQKYCGYACSRRAYMRRKHRERDCGHCGCRFVPVKPMGRWCSHRCRMLAKFAAMRATT